MLLGTVASVWLGCVLTAMKWDVRGIVVLTGMAVAIMIGQLVLGDWLASLLSLAGFVVAAGVTGVVMEGRSGN